MQHRIRQKLQKRYQSKSIAGYQIKQIIGSGGFAKVKRATHIQTKQNAAVKIINKATLGQQELKKIYEQIEIHKQLIHQNIVRVYQVVEKNQKIYIFMEFCQRGQLFQYINKNGPLEQEIALRIFKQVLSAIQYLHNHNICHRDIKCQNIVLNSNFDAKLIDFGFSKKIKDQNTKLQTFCGSPSYSSPQLILKSPYDGKKVDIWCLGVLLYTILSAQLPFDSHNIKKLRNNILSCIYRVHPTISFTIEKLLRKIFTPASTRITIQQLKNSQVLTSYQPYTPNFVDLRTHQMPYDEQLIKVISNKLKVDQKVVSQSIIKNKADQYCSFYYLSLTSQNFQGKPSIYDINSSQFKMPSLKLHKNNERKSTLDMRSSQLSKPKRKLSNIDGFKLGNRKPNLTIRIKSSRHNTKNLIDINEFQQILRPKSPQSSIRMPIQVNTYRKKRLLKKTSKSQSIQQN